ncbi:His Kinase A (phospho-acceptor) domain-containing protein [Bryocella elongata]|uniref:histidine kinase n=1 Tax=Bryocella elongata TaxID=863522 RepID=A0A1H6BH70_9BACT|nr:GAF domain-containing protein [Bryocella elongata]SEG60099.1 His Kinase A (phospho-acceptor) domain-containing protein [Bryocella elongata]
MTPMMEDTGLEVLDLRCDEAFAARELHPRDITMELDGLQRLSRAMLQRPDDILQELVRAAVDLCGADSAGISIERVGGTDEQFYHWVATAGNYSGFLDAILPKYPSACGLCLQRGTAQHFTVDKRFFDILGVEAPLVTDGILLPWSVDETRGTIFIMAHTRADAFDKNDVRLMTMLADFAAMGFKHQRQHALMIMQERTASAARMAHALAHEINNPLQSMTNTAFLLEEGADVDSRALGRDLSNDLRRLSGLVRRLLAIPFDNTRSSTL